jgi:Ras-related protein Rab-8A
VMLVYDVTNRKTFDQVGQWMKNIKERAAENVCKILIANKCDLEEERQVCDDRIPKNPFTHLHSGISICFLLFSLLNEFKVSTREGKELADQFDIPFMETSAKTGEHVEESFLNLARMVIEAGIVPSQDPRSSVVSLSKDKDREGEKKKKKDKCC